MIYEIRGEARFWIAYDEAIGKYGKQVNLH
jgi:hypothetical protein